MEQPQGDHGNPGHVIGIPERVQVSLSESSNLSSCSDLLHHDTSGASDAPAPAVQSSSNGTNTREYPSVYKTLISIKLMYKISLIITCIAVLIVSRHEKPHNPLFAWIVGYVIGSAASIPTVFRHYFLPYPRLCRLVYHINWLLECVFVLWFIFGNYWVVGEESSSQATNLFRLSVALLVLNYIRYMGPLILCAMVLCCCRGLLNRIGGASADSINALPTYKFTVQKNGDGNSGENIGKIQQGGVVAAGTERERMLLGEDAICCICLTSYDTNDELKELPCSHFFHASCVDTWLRIKAFCPLCKCRIDESVGQSPSTTNSSQ